MRIVWLKSAHPNTCSSEEVTAADRERDDTEAARRVREVAEELQLRDRGLAHVLVDDDEHRTEVRDCIADVDEEHRGRDDSERGDRAAEQHAAGRHVAEGK